VIHRFFFRAAFAHGVRDDDISIRTGDSALCALGRSILRVFVGGVGVLEYASQASCTLAAVVLSFFFFFFFFCCVNVVGISVPMYLPLAMLLFNLLNQNIINGYKMSRWSI
jgi:hypothetical protein